MTERPTSASPAPTTATPPPSDGRIGLRTVVVGALLRAALWGMARGLPYAIAALLVLGPAVGLAVGGR